MSLDPASLPAKSGDAMNRTAQSNPMNKTGQSAGANSRVVIEPSASVNGDSDDLELSPDKVQVDNDAQILDIDEPRIMVMEE